MLKPRPLQLFVFFCALALVPTFAQAQSIGFQYSGANPPHAPSNDGYYAYEYDANGNLATVRNRADGKTLQELSYTAFNKLSRTQNESGVITEYRYDANGNRIQKITKNLNGTPSKVTRYFGSMETEGDDKTKYYFLGTKRLAKKKATGQLAFYHHDHLGSTSLVTDSAGNQIHRTDFYEFGAQQSVSSGDAPKYDYNGKELDEETKLLDYGARPYKPDFFQFPVPDSIIPGVENPQNLNRYAYVRNNPMNYIDPTGHVTVKRKVPGVGMTENGYPAMEEKWCFSCGNEEMLNYHAQEFGRNIRNFELNDALSSFGSVVLHRILGSAVAEGLDALLNVDVDNPKSVTRATFAAGAVPKPGLDDVIGSNKLIPFGKPRKRIPTPVISTPSSWNRNFVTSSDVWKNEIRGGIDLIKTGDTSTLVSRMYARVDPTTHRISGVRNVTGEVDLSDINLWRGKQEIFLITEETMITKTDYKRLISGVEPVLGGGEFPPGYSNLVDTMRSLVGTIEYKTFPR